MAKWGERDLKAHFQRAVDGRLDRGGAWLDAFEEIARQFEMPTALLLAIASRETGMRNILGDHNHGHGIMQIDDRWHTAWCKSGRWHDPYESILKGAQILADWRRYVRHRVGKVANLTKDNSMRVAIACYNAGGKPVSAVGRGEHPDVYTTGKDYSADVLARMAVMERLYDEYRAGQAPA